MKNISFALLSLIVGSALSFAAETLRPGEAAKIGVDPAYMTWGQVNALVKRGCELGAMVSHNPVRDRGHRAEISEIDAALALVEKKTGRAPKAAPLLAGLAATVTVDNFGSRRQSARAHREGRGMPGGLRRLLGESRPGGGEDPSRTSASVSRP